MRSIGEIFDTRRWTPGRGPEPEPAIRREAPPAPPNDTFEDEEQASLALATHISRFSKQGLPSLTSPEGIAEYGFWVQRFIAKGIRTSDFLRASEQIKEMEDVFPGEHLALILKLVGQASRLRAEAAATRDRQAEGRRALEDDRVLLTFWEVLDPARRAAIHEAMVRAKPSLARWPRFILACCLDHVSETFDQEAL